MKTKTVAATMVAVLALLTLASVAAAKKPSCPGKPWCWTPTHYAVFTGYLNNGDCCNDDQWVQDTRLYIYSNFRVNDFELDFEETIEGCPTPSDGVKGYLSILKPAKKNDLEIRHNWREEGEYSFMLLCIDGTFEEVGDGFYISQEGGCTVTKKRVGEETVFTCSDVQFNIAIDPIP